MLEATLLGGLLARRFEARLPSGHRPRIDTAGTLVVQNGLPVRISRR